jgi:hypothetical protein
LWIIINEQAWPGRTVHMGGKMRRQGTFAGTSFARRKSKHIHRCNPSHGMKLRRAAMIPRSFCSRSFELEDKQVVYFCVLQLSQSHIGSGGQTWGGYGQ